MPLPLRMGAFAAALAFAFPAAAQDPPPATTPAGQGEATRTS